MFMTDSLRKLRKENPQMIKNWFPTMCMILIVKNKMFMVFERMREMIGKQIRFVVGSSYEPSFCLCISSACNLAVPVRGAKECWTRAKVSENTKRRCRGIPRNENLLRSFMES